MNTVDRGPGSRRLTTPRAAAAAGIVFALLFGTSLVLLRAALPAGPAVGTEVIDQRIPQLRAAVTLMPFAGIAFLWLIGVIRDRLGAYEDRFFATVFLGSGLIFLVMGFVATAVAGALLAGETADGARGLDSRVSDFGRAVMVQISNVYALRMAGVFMICLATMWLRTGLMPRWLAVISYAVALVLLVVTSLGVWVSLLFPAWALLISTFLLLHQPARAG